MNKQVFSLFLLLMPFAGFSQVGVGTNNVDPSAKFQIETNNKGFLQPRIALTGTTDVVTIANPATGLMVYNTATAGSGATAITPGVHYFDGTKWVRTEASVINAGTGTTVTGTGSIANPYVINSSGGSSPAVYVAGQFLSQYISANRTRTDDPVNGYPISSAMRCASIILPSGKWQVNVTNICEISVLRVFSPTATFKMMYWLQNDNTSYVIRTDGIVPSAQPNPTTTPEDYYKLPPVGGGDTLFWNSANFVQPVSPTRPDHTGTFYINNTSGADKTYYLFATEHYMGNESFTTSTTMPLYQSAFANKFYPLNRIYATKID